MSKRLLKKAVDQVGGTWSKPFKAEEERNDQI